MANTLDFNAHRPPVLPVVLPDEAGTKLNVTPPSLDLVEELQANLPQINEALSRQDVEMVDVMYDLAAKLLSCNRNMLRFTGPSLRDYHNMDVEDLVIFFSDYVDFLDGVKRSKN